MACSSLFLAARAGAFVNGEECVESREPWCSPGASACVVFSGVLSGVFIGMWDCFSENSVCGIGHTAE